MHFLKIPKKHIGMSFTAISEFFFEAGCELGEWEIVTGVQIWQMRPLLSGFSNSTRLFSFGDEFDRFSIYIVFIIDTPILREWRIERTTGVYMYVYFIDELESANRRSLVYLDLIAFNCLLYYYIRFLSEFQPVN